MRTRRGRVVLARVRWSRRGGRRGLRVRVRRPRDRHPRARMRRRQVRGLRWERHERRRLRVVVVESGYLNHLRLHLRVLRILLDLRLLHQHTRSSSSMAPAVGGRSCRRRYTWTIMMKFYVLRASPPAQPPPHEPLLRLQPQLSMSQGQEPNLPPHPHPTLSPVR